MTIQCPDSCIQNILKHKPWQEFTLLSVLMGGGMNRSVGLGELQKSCSTGMADASSLAVVVYTYIYLVKRPNDGES